MTNCEDIPGSHPSKPFPSNDERSSEPLGIRFPSDSGRRSCFFNHLGTMPYAGTLDFQMRLLEDKLNDRALSDRLLFVEHFPVYTLGRRGGRDNLVVSEDFLEKKEIEIIQTDRGGDITYHGPGQAVLYPVMDLEKNKLSIPDFVLGLEEIMKETCREFGVMADRDERNHGIWVKNAKIGSVGISIKKGISIHGLALNVNPDLSPFSWINPCGLANQAMTSIAREKKKYQQTADEALQDQLLGRSCNEKDKKLMEKVCQSFVRHFESIFDCEVTRE